MPEPVIFRTITFFVPENPVPKGRPRVIKKRAFTPQRTEHYEGRFALDVRAACAGVIDEPIADFVEVRIEAVWARPRSMRDGPRQLRAGADVDNVVKAVLDGIVQGGAIADDNIVAHVDAWKFYAATGEKPGVHVTIEVLGAR